MKRSYFTAFVVFVVKRRASTCDRSAERRVKFLRQSC